MKKYFGHQLGLLFFFIFSTSVYSQRSYLYFPDHIYEYGAWHHTHNSAYSSFNHDYYFVYFGDTTINNLVYKKCYNKGIFRYRNQDPIDWGFKLSGGLREDTIRHSIYYLKFGDGIESDITVSSNLVKGDSLFSKPIDSVYFDNVGSLTYKYYPGVGLEPKSYGLFLHGIGHTYESYYSTAGDSELSLKCYKINDSNIRGSGCDFRSELSSLKDINPIDHFEVFPNPFQEKINIRFDKHNYKGIELRLNNVFGQCLGSWFMTTNNLELDLDFIPKGIYFIEVIDSKNIYVKQIVKY